VRIEQTGPAACRIWDGSELVAEILSLRLVFFRMRKGAEPMIGPVVPLPLYWQQYADHEHPERNMSSHAEIAAINATDDRAEVICRGATASRAARGEFRLAFVVTAGDAYELHVAAELVVSGGSGWLVTPNPHHGELEFCNLWPTGTFIPERLEEKRYRVCAIRNANGVALIRHHHVESSDKHNIVMRAGDEAAWLAEDENPMVHIESGGVTHAGLCAYMWDMHFAQRVCTGPDPVVLPHGFRTEVRYKICSVPRSEAERWMHAASTVTASGLDAVPVYLRGVHTFKETFATVSPDRTDLWPWTFEVLDGKQGGVDDHPEVDGHLDTQTGFDDSASLRISAESGGKGQWVATTLGPAFGEPPFTEGKRYRLSARVRSQGGRASIALAVHRADAPGLHDRRSYENFAAMATPSGRGAWAACVVETPAIVPAPDRIHLRLVHEGEGTSWFDNVLFEEFA
jgi:hypothetical protein